MTTAEPAVRKPTAKEIAEEALEVGNQALQAGNQLRAELTELRTKVHEGVPSSGESREGGEDLARQVKKLDLDMQGFVDDLNELAQRISVPVGDDAAVHALEKKTADSFAAYSKIIDSHNKAATQAIEELREQMPSVAQLVDRVGELTEKVRLFDEAGMAPASGEDVSGLDARLKTVEVLTGELRSFLANPTDQPSVDHALAEMDQRVTEGLGDVRQEIGVLHRRMNDAVTQRVDSNAGTLVVPPAIATRVAGGVPAIYGQVWQLMNLITELGKDKQADKKMGGYAFRSIDAAMTAVGHAQRQIGVMFQPREILEQRVERYEAVNKDGYRQNWTHVWTRQRYAFVSLVDGSEMDAIEMDGEARDSGDKSTSKADSMRLKYALLQSLMIPITGLPESDGQDGTEGGEVHGRGDRPQENSDPWESAPPLDDAPPAQQAPPPAQDDRTPEEKATAAYHALVALAGIEKPEQRPRLNKILNGIVAAGIGHITIQTTDGRQVTLDQYAATVNAQVGA